MKNKIFKGMIIAVILILTVVYVAIKSSNKSGKGDNTSVKNAIVSKEIEDLLNESEYEGKECHAIYKADNGVVYMTDHHGFFSWDGETGYYASTCKDPNCNHRNKDCSAFFDNSNDFQMYNGYWIYSERFDDGTYIVKADPDGNNRVKLWQISDAIAQSGVSVRAYDGYVMACMCDTIYVKNSETGGYDEKIVLKTTVYDLRKYGTENFSKVICDKQYDYRSDENGYGTYGIIVGDIIEGYIDVSVDINETRYHHILSVYDGVVKEYKSEDGYSYVNVVGKDKYIYRKGNKLYYECNSEQKLLYDGDEKAYVNVHKDRIFLSANYIYDFENGITSYGDLLVYDLEGNKLEEIAYPTNMDMYKAFYPMISGYVDGKYITDIIIGYNYFLYYDTNHPEKGWQKVNLKW